MKKIIISLAIIGAVAGISLGITGALFTANQPITNNVFQAGVLKIKQGVNNLGDLTLSNLMPGQPTDPQKLQMGNDGTISAIMDKIEVTSLVDGDVSGSTSDVTARSYAQKVNVTISDEIGRPIWKGTLLDLKDRGGDTVDGTDRVFLAKQGSGGNYTTRDYWFTFELDPSVNDTYQGEGVNATLSVNATQVKDNKFDAAERLLNTQNNNGGWEWNNPDTNPNTNNGTHVKYGLVGVTATGLLRAYEFSGNSDYFDATEKSAYEIANHWYNNYSGSKDSYTYGRTSWKGGGGYTNDDILFLQRIGKYYDAGNLFSTKAEQAIIDRWNAYDNNSQKVYTFAKSTLRSGLPDAFYWDLEPMMEATVDAANTVSDSNEAMTLRNDALRLAALVAADQNPTGGWFITNWNNAEAQLGQASAIRILQLADDMGLDVDYSTKISNGVTALLTQQISDGSFKGGADGAAKKKSIRTTAYAALALEMTGYHTKAQKAVDYMESQQNSNGGWYEEEGTTNDDEYPEFDSEALRAIVSVNQ